MEPDDPLGDYEPHARLLPPDDRLWRHPSEVGAHGLPARPPAPPRRPPRLWTVAVLAGVLGALVAVGLIAATGNLRRILKVPVVERVALPAGSPAAGPGAPAADEIARRLGPAVVALELQLEGAGKPAQGTGVMFRTDGHLLTNRHVVEGAKRIIVLTADGRRTEGRVVGVDEWTDVAVVKVDERLAIPVAPLGSAVRLTVGDDVVSVGGPTGPHGEPVVVTAVVGALGRQVDREGAPALLDMIETNAPVATASSGGALVDATGAVVGITTSVTPAGAAGASRAGFATPIDLARDVADQLLATGKVVRVWMGVEGSDLDLATARARGVDGGAVVSQVRGGSPAAGAGLRTGDVITAVDGVPVASMGALRVLLRTHRPGDVVTLAVMRGKGTRSLKVRLVARPAQS